MEAPAAKSEVEYIGHATLVLDLAGTRLLTDPLLRNRVAHLRRMKKIGPLELSDIDAVLISHLHFDHLDFPSLRQLDRRTPIVVPRGAGKLIRRKGRFTEVTEMNPGDEIRTGEVTIAATYAEHNPFRLRTGNKVESLGFRVAGERSIYFSGDTGLFQGMAEIGPVDVALVPIWGWGPTLGAGHMDPTAAAESLRLLRPRIAIPIHYGTYYPILLGALRRPTWIHELPEKFRLAASQTAPETDVRILQPGETTEI